MGSNAPHISNQKREVLVPQATFAGAVPIAPAGTFDSGILTMGPDFPFGGGFDVIRGMIAADQPFTLVIDQGTDGAAQDLRVDITSELQPSGNYAASFSVLVKGDYVQLVLTNAGGGNITDLDGIVFVLPVGQLDIVATDDQVAPQQGIMAMGQYQDPQVQVDTGDAVPVQTDDRGNLFSRPYDGIIELAFANVDGPVAANGIHALWGYQAVKDANDDGDATIPQTDAYGNPEPAFHNRSTGSAQTQEQSPVKYDVLRGLARADAALPGAGAFDATPIEISTGNRQYIHLWFEYTRGAAGGSFRFRPEGALRDGGTDYWGQATITNTGAFAAGADTNSQFQREDFEYTSTGAAAEVAEFILDLGRADKVRFPAREVGATGTPGDLWGRFKLYNE